MTVVVVVIIIIIITIIVAVEGVVVFHLIMNVRLGCSFN